LRTGHFRGIEIFVEFDFFIAHRDCSKVGAITPAMESGLSDHIWEIEELVALIKN
jgi:hypothetical protein